MWFYLYFFGILYAALGVFFSYRETDGNAENAFLLHLMSFLYVTIYILFLNYNRDIVADSLNYSDYFYFLKSLKFGEIFSIVDDKFMFGFRLWTWVSAVITNDVRLYFSITAVVIFTLTFIAINNSFGLRKSLFISICYSMYPWFSLYSASGIRQGFALSFILLALSLYSREKLKMAFIFYVISFFFHETVIMFFPIVFALNKKISLKIVMYLYFFVVSLSCTNLFSGLVSSLVDSGLVNFYDKVGTYVGDDEQIYQIGFRFDFLLISLTPILLYFYLKFSHVNLSNNVIDLFKIYLCANMIMFLLNFIPFYDRIAAYSWYMIPFLVFTMINESESKKIYFISSVVFCILNVLAFKYYNWNWYFLLSNPKM